MLARCEKRSEAGSRLVGRRHGIHDRQAARMDLVVLVYKLVARLPNHECFSLCTVYLVHREGTGSHVLRGASPRLMAR